MSNETGKAIAGEKVETKSELMELMSIAMSKNNFKSVAKIASKIAKMARDEENDELEIKRALIAGVTLSVKQAVDKVVGKMINDNKLDNELIEGVFYVHDFGTTESTCRLTKTKIRSPRTSGGGGGAGKRIDVSTTVLLEKYGAEEYKDGVSFNDAHETSTDKNVRYAIRKQLLKKDGLI